jgi:hypothetical protein
MIEGSSFSGLLTRVEIGHIRMRSAGKGRIQGRKSMSWAKSVLPMFTGDSSEKLRIAPDQVQIDTTHFRPQAPAKSAHSRTPLAVNRTAVNPQSASKNRYTVHYA